jgi:hypothetical protein
MILDCGLKGKLLDTQPYQRGQSRLGKRLPRCSLLLSECHLLKLALPAAVEDNIRQDANFDTDCSGSQKDQDPTPTSDPQNVQTSVTGKNACPHQRNIR